MHESRLGLDGVCERACVIADLMIFIVLRVCNVCHRIIHVINVNEKHSQKSSTHVTSITQFSPLDVFLYRKMYSISRSDRELLALFQLRGPFFFSLCFTFFYSFKANTNFYIRPPIHCIVTIHIALWTFSKKKIFINLARRSNCHLI